MFQSDATIPFIPAGCKVKDDEFLPEGWRMNILPLRFLILRLLAKAKGTSKLKYREPKSQDGYCLVANDDKNEY